MDISQGKFLKLTERLASAQNQHTEAADKKENVNFMTGPILKIDPTHEQAKSLNLEFDEEKMSCNETRLGAHTVLLDYLRTTDINMLVDVTLDVGARQYLIDFSVNGFAPRKLMSLFHTIYNFSSAEDPRENPQDEAYKQLVAGFSSDGLRIYFKHADSKHSDGSDSIQIKFDEDKFLIGDSSAHRPIGPDAYKTLVASLSAFAVKAKATGFNVRLKYNLSTK